MIDTRDLEPAVPVRDALLAVEKLILDKKADFILGGPVRSEAALAAMPLLSKYKKVSILTAGALTPQYNALVAEQYDKFKYCFRIHGEAKNLVGEVFANFTELKEKYGFNNLFIIAQDVSHARGAAEVMNDVAIKKGWNVTGVEIYPTGATDFSISSYMAVYVLRDAIERAGSLDSDAVVAELEKTDVMGVYGRLSFDPQIHQVIPATDPKEGAVGSIIQWQNNKRVVVYPKSIAAGNILLPPWMKESK